MAVEKMWLFFVERCMLVVVILYVCLHTVVCFYCLLFFLCVCVCVIFFVFFSETIPQSFYCL